MTPRKVAYSTIAQTVGKFLGFVISAFSLIVLSAHLGTSGVGRYTIITTFVAFFVTIADFGISVVLVRELTQNRDRAQEITGDFLGFRIVYGLAILALAPIISAFIPQYRGIITEGIIIAALAQLILLVNQVFVSILQVEIRLDRAVIAELVNRVSLLGFILIAARLANRPVEFLFLALWATVISSVINTVINYLFSMRRWRVRPLFRTEKWRGVMAIILPMGIFSTLGIIHFNADTIILSLLKSNHDVGIYGYAYNIFQVLFTIPAIFVAVVFPRISSLWVEDRAKFVTFSQKIFVGIALIAFPLAAIVYVLAPFLTVILARQSLPDGLQAAKVLAILAVAIVPWAFQGFYETLLLAAASQLGLIRNVIIVSLLNIGLNLLLIPHFSYLAAASTTLLTEFLLLWLCAHLTRTKLDFRPGFEGFGVIISASALMAIGLLAFLKLTHLPIATFAHASLIRQVGYLAGLGAVGVALYSGIIFLIGKPVIAGLVGALKEK